MEWIKCVDRLPDDSIDSVLIYYEGDVIPASWWFKTFIGYDSHSNGPHFSYKPSHWMEFPDKPKED